MKNRWSKTVIAICFTAFLVCGSVVNGQTVLSAHPDAPVSELLTEWMNALPFKTFFVEINGAYERVLNKKIIADAESQYDVVKLDNGYLSFQSAPYDEIANATALQNFAAAAEEHGIDFLYIQTPFKIARNDNLLPSYASDSSNANADQLLALAERVPILDLREELVNQGLDHYSQFFKTDHHWVPSAALWAAQTIAVELNTKYGYAFDVQKLAQENFWMETYENCYLGSQGKRVGRLYAGTDDFTALLPLQESDIYEVVVPTQDYQTSGTFSQVLFNREIASATDYYNGNNYQAYLFLGDGTGLQEIRNLSNLEGPRVVMFRDSFASAMVPYLACYFSEIDLIDLRYYSNETVETYIEEKAPDIVMVMYNPELLGWNVPFSFNCWGA